MRIRVLGTRVFLSLHLILRRLGLHNHALVTGGSVNSLGMSRAKDDEVLNAEEDQAALVQRWAKRKAYLVTFYTPKQGEPVVLLQASHSPFSRQFPNFDSAVDFLRNQTQDSAEYSE